MRFRSKKADKLIDKKFPVLDKGHVILVDYLGSDQRIVDAARVSYSSGKKKRDTVGLINYLMRNEHTSPFEQVNFTFMIKCPLFVARQIFRSRTFRYNEVSGRYSEMPQDMYLPEVTRLQKQGLINKQGSSGSLPKVTQERLRNGLKTDQSYVYGSYQNYLKEGLSRELSRINLPLSLYTEFYMNADLRNLFNFLKLRLDSHAQKEIQEYGKVIRDIVKAVVPIAYGAFEDNVLNSVKFSGKELEILKKYINYDALDVVGEKGKSIVKDKNSIKIAKTLRAKLK